MPSRCFALVVLLVASCQSWVTPTQWCMYHTIHAYCNTILWCNDSVGLCLTTSSAEVTVAVPMLAIGPPPNTQQPVVEYIDTQGGL